MGMMLRVIMLQALTTAFNDKDTTFGNGVNIAGVNHEVHRFYEEDGILSCLGWLLDGPGCLHGSSPMVEPVKDFYFL